MYSLPYIILAVFLFILYLNECGKLQLVSKRNAQRLATAVLLIFFGLRGHLFSDFINYYPFYQNLPNIFQINLQEISNEYRFELGFVLYSSIVKTFMPSYFGWVFINSLIDIIVFRFIFSRYTNSSILPFIFFLAFNGLILEFNLYRNVKAIDLFLLSIPYLQQRKLIPYIALNLLGATFHVSSVFYIPLYFFLNRALSKYLIWGGIVIANIIYFTHIKVLSDLLDLLSIFQSYESYQTLITYNENSSAYGLSYGYIERTLAILLFSVFYKKLVYSNKANIIFYNCFWLYYICFLVFYENTIFVERVPTLLIFSYWILYTNIVSLKFPNKQKICIMLCVLIPLKLHTASASVMAKYDNLLIGIEDFETRSNRYLYHLQTNQHI